MKVDVKQTQFFITTKTELLTKRVNEWLLEDPERSRSCKISPYMSYTNIKDKGAYMVGCLIEYWIEIEVPDEQQSREINSQLYRE